MLGSVFVILVFALIQIHIVDAREIFHNSLDSREAIEAAGGEIFGTPTFEDAEIGKGIYTQNPEDGVRFPTEGHLVLEQGTIMVWVKVMKEISDQPIEAMVFVAYEDGSNAFYIVHSNVNAPFGVNEFSFGMKIGGTWYDASIEPDWKKGELHHVAGTYGKDGMKLYVDYKLAAENPQKGGPVALAKGMWIGSGSMDVNAGWFRPSFWIQDDVRIFDEQLTAAQIEKASILAVEPTDKLASTWGKVKGRVLR